MALSSYLDPLAGFGGEDYFAPSFFGWPYAPRTGTAPTTGGAGTTTGAGAGTTAQPPGYTRSIPVDFIERENEYVMRADIPGVHKSEIKLQVDGQVLRFGHQAHPDREKADEQEPGIFHRSERVSTFRGRALRMPDNANMDAIKAKYEDGVLEVTIPKRGEAKPEGRTVAVE